MFEKSYNDFQAEVAALVEKLNAFQNKTRGGYTIEYMATITSDVRKECHEAFLWYRWKEVEDKYHRHTTYHVISWNRTSLWSGKYYWSYRNEIKGYKNISSIKNAILKY